MLKTSKARAKAVGGRTVIAKIRARPAHERPAARHGRVNGKTKIGAAATLRPVPGVKPAHRRIEKPAPDLKPGAQIRSARKGAPAEVMLRPPQIAGAQENPKGQPPAARKLTAREKARVKEFDRKELSPADAEARRTRLTNLIVLGKTRSYLTYTEINDHLPDDMLDAEQMENTIGMINAMGIQVYDEAPDAETLLM